MTARPPEPGLAQTLLKLYFSPVGRIRPPLYWAGLLGLAVAGLGVNAVFGILANPVAIYQAVVVHSPGPGGELQLGANGLTTRGTPFAGAITAWFVVAAFCVQAKRLHDAGRSAGWIVGLALLQFVIPVTVGWIIFRGFDLTGFRWNIRYSLICAAAGMLLPLLFKLWIGVSKSRPEPNAHGPRPSGPFALALPSRASEAQPA